MNLQQLGLTILAVSEVPNFLAGMCPSLFTIRTFSDDPEKVKALRHGEIIGGAMAIGVGAGVSLIAESWIPFLACLVTLLILIGAYEHAIRNPIQSPLSMRVGY